MTTHFRSWLSKTDSLERQAYLGSISSSLYLVERVTGYMWVQVPPSELNLLKSFTMKKRCTDPFINAVRDGYMKELNLHHMNIRSLRRWAKSRHRTAVEARAAVFNAISPFMGRVEVASMFWKDHSTVLHAVKNHEMYMAYSSSYNDYYEKATRVVAECSKEMNVYPIGKYRRYISNESEIEVLERTLNNIQETIEHVRNRIEKNQNPVRDYRRILSGQEQ